MFVHSQADIRPTRSQEKFKGIVEVGELGLGDEKKYDCWCGSRVDTGYCYSACG